MKVTRVSVAQVKLATAADLRALVADPTHQVAWPSTLAGQPKLASQSVVTAPLGLTFNTTSWSSVVVLSPPEKQPDVTKSLLKVGETSLALLKDQFPDIPPIGLGLDVIEVVIAGKGVFDDWQDHQRTGMIKPTLATAKTLIELADLLTPLCPALEQAAPQLATVGLLLKVGDTMYQLYLDLAETRHRAAS